MRVTITCGHCTCCFEQAVEVLTHAYRNHLAAPCGDACGPAIPRLVHKQDLQAGGVCSSQDPVDGPEDGLVVDARLRLQRKLCQIGCVAVVIVVSLQRERAVCSETED